MNDRQFSMSIPEQQPTVAHTYELSPLLKFLPGEDDIKLREGKFRSFALLLFLKNLNFRYHVFDT